ncbi:DMT family transporter [Aquimarina sp. BL5]|uniref:DMT family transporter n=1 Tax=Aquimarina sp. BL5 TaxID=1714860 RepID=UPI000E495C48|nr:DMT family transporter [Aquimarina sp. BL5]AXT53467.1 DMT family transporter [Aquimarina sp. BL5]RKN01606.1 DMT family transporter [Aquimarina sp. BL5]
MPNVKLQNYLHFHFIVFVWGFTAILGELISIDALPLVWYRMLMASGFIYIYVYIRKVSLNISTKLLVTLCIAGAIIALHWITFFAAIKASNVSITLAVLSTGAFFTSILEPIFYKRKLIWYEVVFGLMVICGLYIIFNVEGDYYLGIIYAICSAFLSSVFSLINGKIAQQYTPSMISFYELLSGVGFVTIYLIGVSFLGNENDGFSVAFFQLSTSDWVYLIILASFCTAYAFIGSVQVMKYLSPYTVMLTINLEPVYGIVLAYLIFGDSEKMNPGFYYGALIILGTVVLNGIFKNIKKRKRQRS